MLQVGIRRHGKVMSTVPILMIDTGADETMLHLTRATEMGYQEDDLIEETCSTAGGEATTYRPKDISRTELEIGGSWYQLPSLRFSPTVRCPLLGRNMIFDHFDLRMTPSTFELIPRTRTRRR